jgi:hypothetical protein
MAAGRKVAAGDDIFCMQHLHEFVPRERTDLPIDLDDQILKVVPFSFVEFIELNTG